MVLASVFAATYVAALAMGGSVGLAVIVTVVFGFLWLVGKDVRRKPWPSESSHRAQDAAYAAAMIAGMQMPVQGARTARRASTADSAAAPIAGRAASNRIEHVRRQFLILVLIFATVFAGMYVVAASVPAPATVVQTASTTGGYRSAAEVSFAIATFVTIVFGMAWMVWHAIKAGPWMPRTRAHEAGAAVASTPWWHSDRSTVRAARRTRRLRRLRRVNPKSRMAFRLSETREPGSM